jgi:hypothetical protein
MFFRRSLRKLLKQIISTEGDIMAGVDSLKAAVADIEAGQKAESDRVTGALKDLATQVAALQAQIASMTNAGVLSDADAQALADRLEAVVAAANSVAAPAAPAPASTTP